MTTLVMLFVLVLTFVVLYFAEAIQRVLGNVGADVLSRVLALVLAALAVERIVEGIRIAFSI
jgi:multiple antibiotic resistance protein